MTPQVEIVRVELQLLLQFEVPKHVEVSLDGSRGYPWHFRVIAHGESQEEARSRMGEFRRAVLEAFAE